MRLHLLYSTLLATVGLIFSSAVAAEAAEGGFPALSTVRLGGAPPAAATSSANDNPGAVPTYAPPTIPPTADAPFMQKSSLPQGTVFIGTGAVLGGLLALVVLWRAWVAWSIRRSMKRASRGYVSLVHQVPPPPTLLDNGVQLLKRSNPFYKQPADGSTISMKPLRSDEQHELRAQAQAKGPDKRSLFFSPTASSGLHSTTLGGRSGSDYLPSGYYAAGGGDRVHSRAFAMDELAGSREGSPGHPRPRSQSPAPLVPEIARDEEIRLAARHHSQQGISNPSSRAGSRAPSAYLEDLFDARPASQLEHGGV
jgi:hypothetical protein